MATWKQILSEQDKTSALFDVHADGSASGQPLSVMGNHVLGRSDSTSLPIDDDNNCELNRSMQHKR